MSDQSGSMRFGDVSFPALFHGTARLLDPGESPTPPRAPRHGDLDGEFQGEIEISFELLLGAGYVPVHPSHPAYTLYLAASTAPPAPAPAHGIDPHHPDTVSFPFETVVTIPAEQALRFGLVAPGGAAGGVEAAAPMPPARRTPIPPPIHTGPGSRANRRDPPPPIEDFDSFLAFMGDPDRHS